MAEKGYFDEEELKRRLSPEQYRVLRQKATERPWSGEYNRYKGRGVFLCGACGQELFDAQTKFESGSGWPSFWEPIAHGVISEEEDRSLMMRRTEVRCSRCGSHLGHVFEDGPEPTGLRYCINSLALSLSEDEGKKKADTAN